MSDLKKNWDGADRVSDRIIDVLRDEVKRPQFSPLEVLVGQLLALTGYLRTTADLATSPPEFIALQKAVAHCLRSILDAREAEEDKV